MKPLAGFLLLGAALAALHAAPACAQAGPAGLPATALRVLVPAAPAARQPDGGSAPEAVTAECATEADDETLRSARDGKPRKARRLPAAPDDPAGAPRGGGRAPGWRAMLPGALR